MAGGGELAAAFRALAEDAAQAGEHIGNSVCKWYEDTANGADENAARTLAADEENARAFNAIRPKDPGTPSGSDPGGAPAESDISRMMRGEDVAPPPKYSITKPLLEKYRGEEVPGNPIWDGGSPVEYLNESEREQFKIIVKDGKLHDAEGNLFDTSSAHSLHTKGDPRAIFAMDHDGNIYASKRHAKGEFHHSSFLAGGNVAAAGELKVTNGELRLISDKSGHYEPSLDMTRQVVNELGSRGVPMGDVDGQLWAKK